MAIFIGDKCVTVTTMGPGKLSLLSYANVSGAGVNHIGGKSTDNSGKTRWMIGFSHYFSRFAFIWEGQGEAVYRIGFSLLTAPVGTSWTAASVVKWSSDKVTKEDVTSNIPGAVNRDDATTLWVIPDTI